MINKAEGKMHDGKMRFAALAVWTLLVILGNLLYVQLVEEQKLAERFGGKYLIYKKRVTRWIPRLSFWKSNSKNLNASNTSSNGYFANIIEKLKG